MMTENQTQYLLTCSILRQMRNAGLITAKEYADLDTKLLQMYGLSLCSILSDTRLIKSPAQR
ncbi:MAG: SHOCT domain-containing protein [Faecousia sp.]